MLSMAAVSVPDAMTVQPYMVGPQTPILDVLIKMREERIGSTIVVEDGKVVGIFTASDAVTHLIEALQG
jgi:acetoin utilization protein AcuB